VVVWSGSDSFQADLFPQGLLVTDPHGMYFLPAAKLRPLLETAPPEVKK
jgi:hypothetical protein